MKKFEYKVFKIKPRTEFHMEEEYDDRLNKYGIEGWELIGIMGELFIMKREKIEEKK